MNKIIINPENLLLRCINNGVLSASGKKPKLELNKVYQINNSCACGCGEIHYDVGIASPFNFIGCYKCDKELPKGDSIQWCNSSRFA